LTIPLRVIQPEPTLTSIWFPGTWLIGISACSAAPLIWLSSQRSRGSNVTSFTTVRTPRTDLAISTAARISGTLPTLPRSVTVPLRS
jgi:hypothetical protein